MEGESPVLKWIAPCRCFVVVMPWEHRYVSTAIYCQIAAAEQVRRAPLSVLCNGQNVPFYDPCMPRAQLLVPKMPSATHDKMKQGHPGERRHDPVYKLVRG